MNSIDLQQTPHSSRNAECAPQTNPMVVTLSGDGAHAMPLATTLRSPVESNGPQCATHHESPRPS